MQASKRPLLLLASLLILCAAGVALVSFSYSTNFPLQQKPISEGSLWINGHQIGVYWADVATYVNKAWGEQGIQTKNNYSDGTAVLKGVWNQSQGATAKVYATTPPKEGSPCYPEVELRLHTSIAPYSIKGYEIMFSVGGTSKAYAGIVRWNGPLGNFNIIAGKTGSQYGVKNGDVIKAVYSGGYIYAYKNGTLMLQAYDTTYASAGSPGMGFNYQYNSYCPGGPGQNDTYGFSTFGATD